MLRESYILDTLECGDFSFATACLLANRKYNKNNHPDDIKSHQYIISFDPRDAADNGLTMEKAQALGLKFCEENFPGHPAIVCTHPDGHNHSGNIHVHIVIGSIRTREVERKPYMQKPRDWREGMKHSSTAQTMRHLRVEVMELCEGAGLYPTVPRNVSAKPSIGQDGVGSRNLTVKTQASPQLDNRPGRRSLKL